MSSFSQYGNFKTIVTASGNAAPNVSGVANIVGSGGITTSATGNTVTISGAGAGSVIDTLAGDTGTATGTTVTLAGGTNIGTTASASTVTFNLDNSITLPATISAGTSGVITIGTTKFIQGLGTENTFIGGAGNLTLTTGSAINNTAVGFNSQLSLTTGAGNTGIGVGSLQSNTSGVRNTGLGEFALSIPTTGTDNIGIGVNAGLSYTTSESSNIVVGSSGVVGDNNTIRIGTDGTGTAQQSSCFIAGEVTSARGFTATNNFNLPNTSSDFSAGVINVNGTPVANFYGSGNVFLGTSAGNGTLTTGSAINNVSMGQNATNGLTTGHSNVSIGTLSGLSISTGNFNTSFGDGSGFSVTSGSQNILIGRNAGGNLSTESNNILIGNDGVAAESNAIHIGTDGSGTGTQSKAFIAGIFGATVGVTGIPVVVDNAGQLGTVVSSRRFKDDIQDMGSYSDAIMQLRPVTFVLKSDSSRVKQVGLIAEEVAQVLPELTVVDKAGEIASVKYQDLPAMLLNELQKQREVIGQLLERVADLEAKKETV